MWVRITVSNLPTEPYVSAAFLTQEYETKAAAIEAWHSFGSANSVARSLSSGYYDVCQTPVQNGWIFDPVEKTAQITIQRLISQSSNFTHYRDRDILADTVTIGDTDYPPPKSASGIARLRQMLSIEAIDTAGEALPNGLTLRTENRTLVFPHFEAAREYERAATMLVDRHDTAHALMLVEWEGVHTRYLAAPEDETEVRAFDRDERYQHYLAAGVPMPDNLEDARALRREQIERCGVARQRVLRGGASPQANQLVARDPTVADLLGRISVAVQAGKVNFAAATDVAGVTAAYDRAVQAINSIGLGDGGGGDD